MSEKTIASFITEITNNSATILNTDIPNLNSQLQKVVDGTEHGNKPLLPFAYDGLASELNQDETHRLATDTQITTWTENANTSMLIDTTDNKLTIYQKTSEAEKYDATHPFLYSAYNIPYELSQLENNGPDAKVANQKYLEQRAIFVLQNTEDLSIIINSYEKNTNDDKWYYQYAGVIELNNYLCKAEWYTNGTTGVTETNNCIFGEELINIEGYSTIITFSNQTSGNIISKFSQTYYDFDNKRAYLKFGVTNIPNAGEIIIDNITFIKTQPKALPANLSRVSYVESDIMPNAPQRINTGISAAEGFIAELFLLHDDYATRTKSETHQIIMGDTSINIGYVATNNEHFAWDFCGKTVASEYIDDTNLTVTHLLIDYNVSEKTLKVWINGKLYSNSDISPGEGNLYLFSNSGSSIHYSKIRLYSAKIYNHNGWLLRDFQPAYYHSSTGYLSGGVLYDHITGTIFYANDTLRLATDINEKISDYIISGYGAPNNMLVAGEVGQFYKDILTGDYYECRGIINGIYYAWEVCPLGMWYE